MKTEVKPPVIAALVIAVLLVAVFVGMKFFSGSGNLDQGQVKYTPGVPPWMEKGHQGGYQPVGNGAQTQPGQGQAAQQQQQGNAPAGLGPPSVDNKSK